MSVRCCPNATLYGGRMTDQTNKDDSSLLLARRWCKHQGSGWILHDDVLGTGGTAPVFEVDSPDGPRALKIYDAKFSEGEKGPIEQRRIEQQLTLRGHDCPFLVQIYDGGKFENRLYLLMSRAPGAELEKHLKDVPRNKIRQIVDQVAQAAIFLRGKGLCHRDIKAANIFISDDFDHCTLLDISVIRDVCDPIGAGTDHEGQLPVLATARYSPPEYLFRLLDPGPDLWHALNVYQLGSLLHDLIMREPLFQAEYVKSSENRYRFAWIIATVDPVIHADDVDRDLIFTARRALDKNWQRRSALLLEDFLANTNVRQKHAIQVLGFAIDSASVQEADNLAARLKRVRDVAADLEGAVQDYLRKNKVIPLHNIEPGPNDTAKSVVFRWGAPPVDPSAAPQPVALYLHLQLLVNPDGDRFGLSIKLTMKVSGRDVEEHIDLPTLRDEPTVGKSLVGISIDAFQKLALQIMGGVTIKAEA